MSELRNYFLIVVLFFISPFWVMAQTTDGLETKSEVGDEVLQLDKTLALVLTGSPSLEQFSWEIRASEARLRQAKIIPNPTLNIDVEDIGGSGNYNGNDSAQSTFAINQLIELGGKRSARENVALKERDWANWDYKIKRVEVLAEATNKFFHVAFDQERLKLAREALALAKETLEKTKLRVQAGKVSKLQEKNARIALSKHEIKKEHAEHELLVSKLRLASLWGADEVLFSSVRADIYQREKIPSYEDLISQLQNNPKINQAISAQQLRSAKTSLAKANRIPDLTLGAGYRRYEFTEDEAMVVEMSIPLPLFDRGQGHISEAKAHYEKSKTSQQKINIDLKKRLFGTFQELRHSVTEMNVIENEIEPDARDALRIATEGFSQGRFSYLEFVDAQDTFLETKESYIDSAEKFQGFMVEIEALTGGFLLEQELKDKTKSEK